MISGDGYAPAVGAPPAGVDKPPAVGVPGAGYDPPLVGWPVGVPATGVSDTVEDTWPVWVPEFGVKRNVRATARIKKANAPSRSSVSRLKRGPAERSG
jgi:hypothetical protein